ncbi:MAG: DUF2167 domain-containing protein [Magnetococcales bacterium]|nr:DUF2167 domain-containing protein [Magnetococcales bacterium]
MEARSEDDPPDSVSGINYSTYALGREGFIHLNLISDIKQIAKDKAVVWNLLDQTSFNPGKAYTDFNASTDRVAEFGLAALVVGAAAKKFGLFALIAAFLAKFGKVIFLAAAGLAAVSGAWLRRKKTATTEE